MHPSIHPKHQMPNRGRIFKGAKNRDELSTAAAAMPGGRREKVRLIGSALDATAAPIFIIFPSKFASQSVNKTILWGGKDFIRLADW